MSVSDDKRPILVVAGLRPDGHGKFMMVWALRETPEQTGWEFPGGKVEYGESPEQALVREWREEHQVECAVGSLLASHSTVWSTGEHNVVLFYEVRSLDPIGVTWQWFDRVPPPVECYNRPACVVAVEAWKDGRI